MTTMAVIGSALDEPLDVVSVVLAVAGLHGGFAAAAALLRGESAEQISSAATKGAAARFILGLAVGFAAAVYLALD